VPAPLTGRCWVMHELRAALTSGLPTNRGVLISGGPGAGKTAIILTLVQRSCFGQPQEDCGLPELASGSGDTLDLLASQVVAYHFCQADNAPTCSVPMFVRSLAAQLAQAPALAPGYPSLLASDPSLLTLLSPASCARDPGLALRAAILAPLSSLCVPASAVMIILVDGLCEAEHHRPDYGHTLASFLALHAANFPAWLKIVATVRSSAMEAARSLPFHKICLDTAEDERTRKDLSDYIASRISVTQGNSPVAGPKTLRIHRNLVTKFSGFLINKASGCFLYVKLILDLVEKGNLTIKSGSFKVVPQNLSEIYQLAFNLKFSSCESFVQVADILSTCLASLQPISLQQLYSAYSALFISPELGWRQILEHYQTIADVLVLRRDGTLMCFHPTMRDWFVRRRPGESDKFLCELRTGHAALALHTGRQPLELRGRAEKILEMCHHLLKSALYKNCQQSQLPGPGSPGRLLPSRQLAACLTALSAEDISAALACPRNIFSPIIKVSRLLLLAGADPNTRVEAGSLLSVHCSLGHTDLVSLLLEYGAQAGPEEVRAACPGGHEEILQLLAQCGARVTEARVLVEAAASGQVNILEYLLAQDWNNGPLEDAAGLALTKAIQEDQNHIFDLLIDVKDINLGIVDPESGLNSLGAAAKAGSLKSAQILLKKEETNLNLEAALLQAVEAGQEAVLELLLSHGADLGVRNDRGHSLLHLAATRGHCAILRRLLEAGADLLSVTEADSEGLTPLTSSIIGDQAEAAALLIAYSGPGILEAVDSSGRSAMDIAIYQGSTAMVELLLDSGANMERMDKRGIKPLDRVIGHGNSSIVSVFLRKGAKLGSATWAMASGKPDIQLILLNKLMEDGNTLYRQNKLSDAAHRYKYALKRLGSIKSSDWSVSGMPASDWPVEMETNLLLNLSRVERRLDRFETAVSLASRVLDMRPSCAAALVTRAKAARSLGLAREAFIDFNLALELMPGNRELRRVILRMKEGFKNTEMSSSFMSCSNESIRFIDDGSAVDMMET